MTLTAGGVIARTCVEVAYPALSEYLYDAGTVVDLSVAGILNAEEYVSVRTELLALGIHDGAGFAPGGFILPPSLKSAPGAPLFARDNSCSA